MNGSLGADSICEILRKHWATNVDAIVNPIYL